MTRSIKVFLHEAITAELYDPCEVRDTSGLSRAWFKPHLDALVARPSMDLLSTKYYLIRTP